MTPLSHTRAGRSLWPILAFFVGAIFIVLLAFYRYLLPAIRASHNLDKAGRQHLAAISSLVLALVLVMLLAGLLLTIRPGRFFLPRQSSPRTRTKYVDAWREAGKRLQTPDEHEDEREEERNE